MKKIIYLFVLTIGIISCSSDDETQISNTDLIGTWNWTNTDGGIGFHIHETPETTGKTNQIILMDNYEFSIIENGSEISNGTYELTMRESISSQEKERFITYSGNFQQPQGVVISGIVRVLENSTLNISDNIHDGIGSLFEKVK